MTEEEYKSVVENNRLPNGLLFGLPVVYDTDRDDLKPGKQGFKVSWVWAAVRLIGVCLPACLPCSTLFFVSVRCFL